jgi:hypothetical protein
MMWKPIETAPKDATRILICQANDADGNPLSEEDFGLFVQRAAWWEGEGWVVYCGLVRDPICFFDPTHWKEIPAPPLSTTTQKAELGLIVKVLDDAVYASRWFVNNIEQFPHTSKADSIRCVDEAEDALKIAKQLAHAHLEVNHDPGA